MVLSWDLSGVLAIPVPATSCCGPLIGNNGWKRKPWGHFAGLTGLIQPAKRRLEATESPALTTVGGWRRRSGCRRLVKRKKEGGRNARPPGIGGDRFQHLGDDLDDLIGIRIDDHDLVADHDELVAAPLRIDGHDFGRQRVELDALTRHAGADADGEVHVFDRRDVLVADHARDLGPLLGRELRGRAGLAGGLRLLGRRLVHLVALAAHVVLTALGLHVVLAPAGLTGSLRFLALGLGGLVALLGLAFGSLVALTTLAALGLHIVLMSAGLTDGLGFFLAAALLFGALALRGTRRVLGPARLHLGTLGLGSAAATARRR